MPPLSHFTRKGESGWVAVLGGSEEYIGGPYFSAISALRTGADLAHIFTPVKEAIVPLKSYTPDLVVHDASTPE